MFTDHDRNNGRSSAGIARSVLVGAWRRMWRAGASCRAIAFAAALLTPCAAAPAAEVRPQSSIEVTSEAEVEVRPDVALLEFAVRTEAETAGAAAKDNAARMQRVIGALRKALGPHGQLQTGAYTLRPSYAPPRDTGPGVPPRVVGYVATNTLQAKTTDLARLGEFIDIGVSAGANQVQRVAYTLRDQSAARREVLRDAATAARAKADALAMALGMKVVAFHSLFEQDVGDVRPLVHDAMLARAESTVTPMEPGVITVRARVVLTMLVSR